MILKELSSGELVPFGKAFLVPILWLQHLEERKRKAPSLGFVGLGMNKVKSLQGRRYFGSVLKSHPTAVMFTGQGDPGIGGTGART